MEISRIRIIYRLFSLSCHLILTLTLTLILTFTPYEAISRVRVRVRLRDNEINEITYQIATYHGKIRR